MKLASSFALFAAASAVDVEPPTISLNLEGMAAILTKTGPTQQVHYSGAVQPDGSPVGNRRDYTMTCAAGASDATDCGLPTAKAYDHHDGNLNVERKIVQVDDDNKAMDTVVAAVDYSKRGTYRILYDACDASKNCAEQAEVLLVLDDKTAPVIVPCASGVTTVEAATNWKLCASTVATDNMDSDASVLKTLTYTVSHEADAFEKDGNLLCDKCTFDQASAKIDTLLTGTFTVRLDAHDHAGKYSANGKSDNTAVSQMIVKVQDTTVPVISVQGAQPATHECATQYNDAGATAKDTLDDKLKRALVVGDNSASVDSATVGSYTVNYNVKDSHANAAVSKHRAVNVVDTTNPVLTRVGNKNIEHVSEQTFVDSGSVCVDSCDKTGLKTTTKWVGKAFTDKDVGAYVQQYTCTDKSGNAMSTSRTWTVVDKKAPVISVVGPDSIVLEASTTAEYTDSGATCHDYVDENLSKSIVISGDLVDYRTPGTYTIKYNCKDLSNNAATQMSRKVVVKDTTCPTVTLNGATNLEIEGGFPYVDAGAKASDTLDGDITAKITTSGDTVNTAKAFYAYRSCAAIKKAENAAKSGYYSITTGAAGALKRVQVYCDMTYGKTYYACDNCMRVVPYKANAGGCAAQGMKMATFGVLDKAAAKKHYTKDGEEESKYFPADALATSNYYLCSPTDGAVNSFVPKHGDISHAEQGKYIINFHVSDKAGNTECLTKHRTVVVKDTLPPVITLHLGGKMIHMSDATKKGIDKVTNPAGTAAANPFFMAETQTSVNGWIIGAVASAITGVALLGFAGRKAAVVEVPV
jgi:hypothetical protein